VHTTIIFTTGNLIGSSALTRSRDANIPHIVHNNQRAEKTIEAIFNIINLYPIAKDNPKHNINVKQNMLSIIQ
jgi:hypothetical protein